MLVYVRPSNEALLRARVPGAQDQRGCPSHPFYRGGSASKKNGLPAPSHLSEAARCASIEDHQAPSPPLFCRHPLSEGSLDCLTLSRASQIIAKETADTSGVFVDASEGGLKHEVARCDRTG